MRKCINMGFNGNVSALWHYCDSDRSGFVTLYEIHPSTAIVLADFKKFIDDNFNGSANETFQALAEYEGSHFLSRAVAVQQLRACGYRGPAALLFDMLDRRRLGTIFLREIEFFERWVVKPSFLFCKPDENGLQKLMDALLEEYGPPLLKVWRKVLDRKGMMRVDYKDLYSAWKGLLTNTSYSELAGFPKTEFDFGCAWRALDTDRSGWISLLEFDPKGHEVVSEFRRWTEREYGGPLEAYRNLAASSYNGYVTIRDMNLKSYPFDLSLLFETLAIGGSQERLSQDDFRFLASWDLDAEDFERQVRFLQTSSVAAQNKAEDALAPTETPR
jgi:hypothetical protein